ncbi:MAG TPA: TetR family transcriptional regulator [Pseudomonadales bacterium]|nr:TetR family transcriptional regulator [Pseudomonadales bacterium]
MARPKVQQDQVLLQSAMNLFWRNGFSSTGIRELESALGVKAPSLYNRFGSKEALYQSVLAHYLETVVGWRIQHYLQAEQPLVGLREFFDTTYSYISDETPALACLLVNTSLELDGCHHSFSEPLKKGASMIRIAFKATLQNAQQLNQLSVDANIDNLAEFLYLGLQGLLVTSKVETDISKLKQKVDILFSLLPLTRNTTE